MRHDPASAAVVIMLKSLKMHGMAQAVGDLTEQGSPAFEAAIPILSQLLKAETAEREVRSVAYQLKVARFPAYRDLNGFDFASSEINEALVRQLHRCEFIEQAHNAVFLGGPPLRLPRPHPTPLSEALAETKAAAEFNIAPQTVRNWLNEAHLLGAHGTGSYPQNGQHPCMASVAWRAHTSAELGDAAAAAASAKASTSFMAVE